MANRSEARPTACAHRLNAAGRPNGTIWNLAPSDFAFLWDECPRCFYLKVVRKRPRPRSPFPSVFGRIDRAIKAFTLGRRSESLAEGAPVGTVVAGDRWVTSAPIYPEDSPEAVAIRGRTDALIACDDGSIAIVDFKTTIPKPEHLAIYGRQLHAYGWALEHPAAGPARTVGTLGLLCFAPETFGVDGRAGTLTGGLHWVMIPRDNAGIRTVPHRGGDRARSGRAAPPSPSCGWCSWEEAVRAT